ncbi:hypothetical protein [Hymenobacter metallicola]|uniref:Uncharacterized protein n=1 Tax=Hymenobacter metallicola TaxID=2563114 RepID=A0A4Z0QI52_9BACT|nr:hypothetical protein [Hymenobacter metallicola]TGE29758.1 hypothetical protein E5K02_09950 [Hymenobacter metallicola]
MLLLLLALSLFSHQQPEPAEPGTDPESTELVRQLAAQHHLNEAAIIRLRAVCRPFDAQLAQATPEEQAAIRLQREAAIHSLLTQYYATSK